MPAYRVVERCSICGKPITEGQAKESDGGKPVHQECLIDLSKGTSNSLRKLIKELRERSDRLRGESQKLSELSDELAQRIERAEKRPRKT